MSNSTVLATAKAPVVAPGAPAISYYVVPSTVVVAKVAKPVNFSWIGIVGILAAFLVLAIIALVCLWYKKHAYKQALMDQREIFTAKRRPSSPGFESKDWSTSEDDEESDERRKRGRLILADYEKALGSSHTTSTRFSEESDLEYSGSRKSLGVLEQEIPACARDKHMVKENQHANLWSKSMPGDLNWNLGENLVDEVFYKGEEGSAQMGVRYNRTDFENFDIFTKISPRKKRLEGESASLCKGDHCTIAVKSPPKGKLTLRANSLPVYRHSYNPSSSGGRHDMGGQYGEALSKVDHSESPSEVAGSPHLLPTSPAHSFSPESAYGIKSLTKASSWTRKPSRLGLQSNSAVLHNSAFMVPPQTSKLLRRVSKVAESKWSIANYTPFAPPPALPVPLQPPSLTPTVAPSQVLKCNEVRGVTSLPPPPPPPFPALPCSRCPHPPSPPPLPPPPRCKPTPLLSDDGKSKTTPPPLPPPLPTLPCTRSSPPASRPASGSAPRPTLAPLIVPGRPDLSDSRSSEDFQPTFRSPPARRHQKMRPLHWDKLKPESRSTMVWDTISDSMELDEEMIENLFGVITRSDSESEVIKRSSNVTAISEKTDILHPKKAHNIAIQLRARGLVRARVCNALLEGGGLDQENLEILVKMAPTEEELTRFQEYQGDLTLLGPADRFVKGILQSPNAFERLQAMLFKASYCEELHPIQDTIATIEACKELKGSRSLIKLLEAVLKTGNRLNTGTFRGDAKAFKLDTLLKLADVKGVDGKTTLLHFVIQEIMKAEGARAARLAGVHDPTSSTPTSTSSMCTSPGSTSSSSLSHFATTMDAEFDLEITRLRSSDDFRRAGMDVVRGIPVELGHVRKAGGLDIVALRLAVSKLQTGLQDLKATLDKLQESRDERTTFCHIADDVFREKMTVFVQDAETRVHDVQTDLDLVLVSVKDISVYFYGETDTAKSNQPALKVFMVMREFMAMLEQACKDVMKADSAATDSCSPSRFPSRPSCLVTLSK